MCRLHSFRIRYLFWSHFEITTNNQVLLLPDYVHKKTQKVWSFIFQIIFLTIFWFLINIHIFMAWIMTELLLIFSQLGCQMKWCLTFHLNWIVERKVYFCLRVCDIHERTKIMVVHFKIGWVISRKKFIPGNGNFPKSVWEFPGT